MMPVMYETNHLNLQTPFLRVLRYDVKAKLLPGKHLIGEGGPGSRRLLPPSQKSYSWP